MNEKRLYEIILGPLMTEKSVQVAEVGTQVVFKVAKNASKTEIKEAVEKLFNVAVKTVRTTVLPGKAKRFKFTQGRTPGIKKAYVSLVPGHDINIEEFE